MKNHTLFAISCTYAVVIAAGSAQAAALFTFAGPTAQFASPGAFDVNFDSTGGAGLVTFRIDGFKTLDGFGAGANDQDTFTLSLNGIAILSGSWNLGGGGGDVIIFGDPAATAVAHSPAFGQGGTVDISTPLALAAGANLLDFAYASAKPLGLGDEGWDLRNVAVTGPGTDRDPIVPPGVPEPSSWALMLTGFLGLGAMLRRPARNGEGHSQK